MLQDKAKELLGFGLANNVVASAVGVSESMISQWMSDAIFAQEVQEMRMVNLADAANRDKKYNSIEDRLIEKLEEKLEGGLMFTSPRDILAAIRIINSAVRRGAPQEVNAHAQRQFVHLHLPASSAFAAKFVLNAQSQVIEIAGRSLATMPAKGVVAQLEEMNKKKEENKVSERQDVQGATERLNQLVSLEHLPVAEVL